MDKDITIEIIPSSEEPAKVFDFDKEIFDLNSQIDLLTSKADALDCIIAAGSGLLCGAMDIMWVGDFSLSKGRNIAAGKVDDLVKKTAHLLGCDKDDIKDCIRFLEERFPIPSDGNTNDWGGGLQHHLRDFSHHPTVVGLIFSLLTQFTCKSYGTTVTGRFTWVDIPERSKIFIGKDVPGKIINGTIIWFFHLVSDMAGSSSTAGLSGGTGLPGPILSLAKELSVLPFFKDLSVNERSFSQFLSGLFNGTLLAKHDANGRIIKDSVLKIDLRGELGIAEELGRQAVPVIANEAIVRIFYFIRRLATELKKENIKSVAGLRDINWKTILPGNSPTLTRMLTIATGVFTTVDITDAIISGKYWVSINYVGVGRFAIAVNSELGWALKRQNIRSIQEMYRTLDRNTYQEKDDRIYRRLQSDMNSEKLGLTLEETEILYNMEYLKTKNDIENAKMQTGTIKKLKTEWLDEWARYMAEGFDEFVEIEGAELHWYSQDELTARIRQLDPSGTWYKLVLLEAMLFTPYFPLGTEKDKKGREVVSKKYDRLNSPVVQYDEKRGDKYLETVFSSPYCPTDFIKRLRKCYSRMLRELNEVLKSALVAVTITAGAIIITVMTAGMMAPQISVALVGSQFAGLHGISLTNACLAYLGGGAIAAHGAGIAGGTAAIVGGGALIGAGVGAGAGGITAAVMLGGKKNTILQSAKLMVSVREIFLNEDKDVEYSTSVYERYVRSIAEIEKDIVELKLKENVASKSEKKELNEKIKNAEESVKAMKIAMKSMNTYIGAYKTGLGIED